MLYWIDAPAKGRLAISSRPRGGDWLEVDVRNWRNDGIDCIVSLLTPPENDELDLEKEAIVARHAGLEFLELPIADLGTPSSQPKVEHIIEKVVANLDRGRSVAIHCRQGIGRSGMITAAILIAQGISSGDALNRITQARGVPVPETPEQVEWVERLAKPATP